MSEEVSLRDFLSTVIEDLKTSNSEDHQKINDSVLKMDKTLTDHNGRLRKNEEWRFKASGALLIIGLMTTGLLLPLTVYFIKDSSANEKSLEEKVLKIISENYEEQ